MPSLEAEVLNARSKWESLTCAHLWCWNLIWKSTHKFQSSYNGMQDCTKDSGHLGALFTSLNQVVISCYSSAGCLLNTLATNAFSQLMQAACFAYSVTFTLNTNQTATYLQLYLLVFMLLNQIFHAWFSPECEFSSRNA